LKLNVVGHHPVTVLLSELRDSDTTLPQVPSARHQFRRQFCSDEHKMNEARMETGREYRGAKAHMTTTAFMARQGGAAFLVHFCAEGSR
jgi:hypothetical protein